MTETTDRLKLISLAAVFVLCWMVACRKKKPPLARIWLQSCLLLLHLMLMRACELASASGKINLFTRKEVVFPLDVNSTFR